MNDELLIKLDELLLMQQELMAMMKALHPGSFLSDWLADDDELIDSNDAMKLLKIGSLTLRRRRQEGVFKAKKIGKKWFYYKSSLQ